MANAPTLKLTISVDQVGSLVAALPPAARQPGCGIAYVDGVLTVPAAFSAAAAAVMDQPGWDAPPDPKLALLAYAAEKRWLIETGGITLSGVPIATDDRSKIMIMGARVAAAANPGWETVWHGADGQTYPLNAAQMIAISDAVEAHVNATFAAFATVKAAIDAGTITTTAEIDAAFA